MNKNFKDLAAYFLIAYSFSWILWIPRVLHSHEIIVIPSEFLVNALGPVGTFGPMVAALFLTYSRVGKEGMRSLLRQSFGTSFNGRWWLIAIVLWPALTGIGLLMAVYIGGETVPEILLFTAPWLLLLPFIRTVILGGPLGEEMGWRGYALPRLQSSFNELNSGLILGVLWGFWHLPAFWAVGGHNGMPFPLFLLIIISQTPIYTWIYNNTNRSLWPVIIFHAFQNTVLFNVLGMDSGPMYFSIVFYFAVLLIVGSWFAGAKKIKLTHQP